MPWRALCIAALAAAGPIRARNARRAAAVCRAMHAAAADAYAVLVIERTVSTLGRAGNG